MASLPGNIQNDPFPVHVPASFASFSCILPGVAASVMAAMSASVQPGGRAGCCGCCCAGAAAGLESFLSCAIETPAATDRDSAHAHANIVLRFIRLSWFEDLQICRDDTSQ